MSTYLLVWDAPNMDMGLSTIVGAHCIYVLENGSIAEQGTHQTLLEQKGRYAAFWQCQQGNITH